MRITYKWGSCRDSGDGKTLRKINSINDGFGAHRTRFWRQKVHCSILLTCILYTCTAPTSIPRENPTNAEHNMHIAYIMYIYDNYIVLYADHFNGSGGGGTRTDTRDTRKRLVKKSLQNLKYVYRTNRPAPSPNARIKTVKTFVIRSRCTCSNVSRIYSHLSFQLDINWIVYRSTIVRYPSYSYNIIYL